MDKELSKAVQSDKDSDKVIQTTPNTEKANPTQPIDRISKDRPRRKESRTDRRSSKHALPKTKEPNSACAND